MATMGYVEMFYAIMHKAGAGCLLREGKMPRYCWPGPALKSCAPAMEKVAGGGGGGSPIFSDFKMFP